MQTGRRGFITGVLAVGLMPAPTWADAGSPAFLSAAALADGRYVLCGLDAELGITFQLPLPARGHAAAAHPLRPEAVAFARRPGRFAIVIDCATGRQKAVLTAPAGRHFYGHGAFSADGAMLYTTENDYEAGRGVVGVWDARAGYVRVDEWESGGIGPHDIKRLAASDVLVIANGGIDTHPGSGRTKLNIPTMRPNLSYLANGAIIEQVELPANLHKNSIRHLAVSADSRVAFGMQWQGALPSPALVGHHRLGDQMTLMESGPNALQDMQGYVGSIAFSHDGTTIAATSPRGGAVHMFDARSGQMIDAHKMADVCGIASLPGGFLVTSGTGELRCLRDRASGSMASQALRWDNHLIPI
ncbi:DUF1513 domain-containing protein [Roseobacteraceae bacterium S113]